MFSQKKAFLISPEVKPSLFSISSKNEKNPSQENFSRESFSYTSGNKTPEKISYISSKETFSYILEKENPAKIPYISRNGNSKNLFIFQEVTF